jgi:signal transduction histidine kinase/CheY-like chemotaxis protein
VAPSRACLKGVIEIPDLTAPYAVVLTPEGRDSEVATAMLSEAGISARAVRDLDGLVAALDDNCAFVVLTEETVRSSDLRSVVNWLAGQPSWSDLPFIVLTPRGGDPERNPAAARLSEQLGNVTFLERPFHVTSFISIARTAMKGRLRQYDARTNLLEIGHLNATLEERVAQRTAELEIAHRTLVDQVAQRERAEQQLRQAQKLEAIGQLTGGVAHDFNNLLMAVLGNLELLRKHFAHDAKALRLLDSATKGARRGAALTQRLLAFGRRQDLIVKPTNLADLVAGMDDLLARSIDQNIAIERDIPLGIPLASVDSNQVELALLNLAINARDAMPDGGTLSISLRRETVVAGNGDLKAGNYVVLAVADTGHGMDKDTLSKAIDPFFSTKGAGKGTGLGLSMVHGLAVQLDGTFRLSSIVGKGTTAELWLPASSEEIEEPILESTTSLPGTTTSLRILMVDDDALIAMSSVDMLEDLGHVVTEANSGAAALAVLKAGNVFDLMITDYSMPGMNGAELGRAVRNLVPDLPILVASGYAELPSGAGIDLPRLGKPYTQSELAAEISKLFGSTQAFEG